VGQLIAHNNVRAAACLYAYDPLWPEQCQ